MAHFDKNSDGYLGNGHYSHDGKEWMSIWTFKNRNVAGTTENTNDANALDSKLLLMEGNPNHTCKPDFGFFREVYIFPIDVLKDFYTR